jgi:hypothetical protein
VLAMTFGTPFSLVQTPRKAACALWKSRPLAFAPTSRARMHRDDFEEIESYDLLATAISYRPIPV